MVIFFQNAGEMKLSDLEVYTKAMEIGQIVWEIAMKWDFFQKDTVGKQYVKAADSIASNISEGYGRFHFADAKKFYYYSRGSLSETFTWTEKAIQRNFITQQEYDNLTEKLSVLGKKTEQLY